MLHLGQSFSKRKRQISDFFFQNYVCDSKIVEKIYRSNLASLLTKDIWFEEKLKTELKIELIREWEWELSFENLHLNENCELQFFLNVGVNGNGNCQDF